jgi:hypothetical protein
MMPDPASDQELASFFARPEWGRVRARLRQRGSEAERLVRWIDGRIEVARAVWSGSSSASSPE